MKKRIVVWGNVVGFVFIVPLGIAVGLELASLAVILQFLLAILFVVLGVLALTFGKYSLGIVDLALFLALAALFEKTLFDL